jgi:hypothetical protein
MYQLLVYFDTCLPFGCGFVPSNARQFSGVFVLTILRPRYLAQVRKAVIGFISVNVVYLTDRPFAVYV